MRFIVTKLWASLGGPQGSDCLGPAFTSLPGYQSHSFIHT
jgi:hypothetical protein